MQERIRETIHYLHRFITYPQIAKICDTSESTIRDIVKNELVVHKKTLVKIAESLKEWGESAKDKTSLFF